MNSEKMANAEARLRPVVEALLQQSSGPPNDAVIKASIDWAYAQGALDIIDALAALRRVRNVQRCSVTAKGEPIDHATGEYVRWSDIVAALDG